MNAANLPNSVIHTNKSPELRVIIAAVEIIKARFGVVIVASVAEGILVAYGVAGGVGDGAVAPGVVAVLSHDLPRGGPDDGDDIPLDIVEIVEQHSPVGKAHALAGAVVEEPHNAVPDLQGQDFGTVDDPPKLELFYSAIPNALMAARNSAASPPALAALVASIVYQEYSKS